MEHQLTLVSVKGKLRKVRAIPIGPNVTVAVTGRLVTVGVVHDEFWLERTVIPHPATIIEELLESPACPDLFTFTQRLPDVSPKYEYHLEWDNFAVATFDSYAEWFEKQVNRSVRKHVRKAAREGVVAEVVPFTDELVSGICDVYNELPVRQGRAFWHFGKGFEAVKRDNATFLDRSVFIAARRDGELIGFLKLVIDTDVASIMQILSKSSQFDRRPTNALLAKAVEVCESRRIKHLTYGEYVYGNKLESSLIDFKRNNGFVKVDVPRYVVPLTFKGRIAMRIQLHKGLKPLLPGWLTSVGLQVREVWQKRRFDLPAAKEG